MSEIGIDKPHSSFQVEGTAEMTAKMQTYQTMNDTLIDLPPEKIDGIRIAGSIHDIGKLSIPAKYCPSRKNCLKSSFP